MKDASDESLDGTPGSDEQILQHYLAIPYVAVFYSTVNDDGIWVRRADYPELPDCEVEAPTAIEAMDKLEERRVTTIVNMLATGHEPPAPRPPLRGGSSGLSSETSMTQVRQAKAATA